MDSLLGVYSTNSKAIKVHTTLNDCVGGADTAEDFGKCARECAEEHRGCGGHGNAAHGSGRGGAADAGGHLCLPHSHQQPRGQLGPGGLRGPAAHLRSCLPNEAPTSTGRQASRVTPPPSSGQLCMYSNTNLRSSLSLPLK